MPLADFISRVVTRGQFCVPFCCFDLDGLLYHVHDWLGCSLFFYFDLFIIIFELVFITAW